jgi:molybdopterin/thiamine biosynthesis adenylyltransferase
MAGKFHHEQIYRGDDLIQRLAAARITICGAGALGSNLADNLVRQGARSLRVIDSDRVEEHNVSTQIYGESDVGGWKVEVLRNRLFRTAGVEVEAVRKQLVESNARVLLKGSGLVLDTFDNSDSRRLVQQACRAAQIPCLHVGLFADYGEAIWDADYRVPADVVAMDVCDYPLARNLVLLVIAVASESIQRWIDNGTCDGFSVTLRDLAIRAQEPAPV